MRAPAEQTLLEAFRKRTRVNLKSLSGIVGKSVSVTARYCLPADHPNHTQPPPAAGRAIREWSGGLVHLGNYADLWTPEIDAEWLAAGAFAPSSAEAAP